MLKRIRISCHRQRITASVGIAPDARVYIVHTAFIRRDSLKRSPQTSERVSALSALPQSILGVFPSGPIRGVILFKGSGGRKDKVVDLYRETPWLSVTGWTLALSRQDLRKSCPRMTGRPLTLLAISSQLFPRVIILSFD